MSKEPKEIKDAKKKITELRQLWANRDVRRQLLSNNADVLRTCIAQDQEPQTALFELLHYWHEAAWNLPCNDLPLHFEAMWNELFNLMVERGELDRIKSIRKTYVQDHSHMVEPPPEKIYSPALVIAVVGAERRQLNGLYTEKKGTMSSTRPVYIQELDEQVGTKAKPAQLYFFEYDDGQRGWYLADSIGKKLEDTYAQCKTDARLPYGLPLPWRENHRPNANLKVKVVHSDRYLNMAKDFPCKRFEKGQCHMEIDCPFQHDESRIIKL
eukprot:GEMP01083228.1.p1 GENE.GEMP01083228.1~~GEMP01083228.1.p1  ORF type:complete len:269 (+),score=36.71 GEMP01083228.1:78-884(+)